jgi:hypothetical protein
VLGDRAFMWTQLMVVVTPPNGGPSITREGHTLSVLTSMLTKEHGSWMPVTRAWWVRFVGNGLTFSRP